MLGSARCKKGSGYCGKSQTEHESGMWCNSKKSKCNSRLLQQMCNVINHSSPLFSIRLNGIDKLTRVKQQGYFVCCTFHKLPRLP